MANNKKPMRRGQLGKAPAPPTSDPQPSANTSDGSASYAAPVPSPTPSGAVSPVEPASPPPARPPSTAKLQLERGVVDHPSPRKWSLATIATLGIVALVGGLAYVVFIGGEDDPETEVLASTQTDSDASTETTVPSTSTVAPDDAAPEEPNEPTAAADPDDSGDPADAPPVEAPEPPEPPQETETEEAINSGGDNEADDNVGDNNDDNIGDNEGNNDEDNNEADDNVGDEVEPPAGVDSPAPVETGTKFTAPSRLVDADEFSTAYSVFSDGTIFLRGRIGSEASKSIIAAAEAILGPENVVNEYVIDETVDATERPFFVEDLILFETGGAEIAPEFDALISAGVLLLKREATAKVIILGFTDSTGDTQDNIALSQRRVQAIIDRSLELGADRSQLVGRGLGEADPIADNETEAGRRQNRRVEFILEGIIG